MNVLRTIAAWIAMLRLLLDPPALFHRLHGLTWYRAVLRATLPTFENGLAGQSVIEVGCAGGDFCAEMAALGAHVNGVDRSEAMVRRARRAHPALRFDQADAMALPGGAQQYDVVFSASLLNVVSDPVTVLIEMVRVCRPGGTVAMLVPAAEYGLAQARQWVKSQRLTGFDAIAYLTWHRLARKITADKVQQWLTDALLDGVRIERTPMLGGMVWAIRVHLPQ